MSTKIKIFEGTLENILWTTKVVKFTIQEIIFIGFETNRSATLLQDIKDYEHKPVKIEIPEPVKIQKDKNTGLEQIVLTNHTKIFVEDQLIFYPVEQQNEIDEMDHAIELAEQERINYEELQKQKSLANQTATPKQISNINRASDIIKKGGFYEVNGKKIPDAVKIESEVNQLVEDSDRVFNLYVIECDKNDDKAWAKVRVEDALTKQIKEDAVVHHYNTLWDAFLLDLLNQYEKALKKNQQIENPIQDFDANNKPILTSNAKKIIIIRMLKFKQFAERDALTKAASRAYLKMLNREWRSKEEIESEQMEVGIVNSSQ